MAKESIRSQKSLSLVPHNAVSGNQKAHDVQFGKRVLAGLTETRQLALLEGAGCRLRPLLRAAIGVLLELHVHSDIGTAGDGVKDR